MHVVQKSEFFCRNEKYTETVGGVNKLQNLSFLAHVEYLTQFNLSENVPLFLLFTLC